MGVVRVTRGLLNKTRFVVAFILMLAAMSVPTLTMTKVACTDYTFSWQSGQDRHPVYEHFNFGVSDDGTLWELHAEENYVVSVSTWTAKGAAVTWYTKDTQYGAGKYIAKYVTNDTFVQVRGRVSTCKPTTVRYRASIGVSPVAIPVNGSTAFSGAVAPAAVNQVIYLQRLVSGAWRNVASTRLNSSSRYSIVQKVTVRGVYRYRAYKPAVGNSVAGYSSVVELYVGVHRVTSALSPTTMARGSTTRMSGAVAPARSGKRVYLQRLVSGSWRNVTSTLLSSSSAYAFNIRLTSPGTYTYRVHKPGDSSFTAGYSPPRAVRVT